MNTRYKSRANRLTHSGLTLIEVMITVLILASGILGTAALQSRSLKFNNQAYLNTHASMLAYDMLDRIIANKAYSIDGAGYSASRGNIPSSYPVDCETGTCEPDELATYDIDQWKFLLNQHLPNADGTITASDTPEGRSYTIIVFFDDSRGQDALRQIEIRSQM